MKNRNLKKSVLTCELAFLAAGILNVSSVQAADEAGSLNELLQLIKSAKISESKENKAREAEFRRSKANQASLLKKAEATKDAEERKSIQLEKQYADNENQVAALQQQLDKRLGSLKELFGHLTSTAGDARAEMSQSYVSAQIPGRTDFLDGMIAKMGSNTKLPTLEEIERLWYEINREMVEGGRVVKFPATVVKVDGEQVQQDVVRVGVFNLLSDGAYLEYNPKNGVISELARQPDSAFTKAAAELQAASDGVVKTGIDPTGPSGGSFLSALINSPSLVERWHQGQLVGYIITAVGAFAVLLALWRFIVLSGMSAKVSAQLKSDTANTNNPLGRILKVGEENPGMDAESLELKLHEAVLKERPAIESGLNLLKIIAMLAPLLGLLGTVTGMIITFQAITIFGAGDPKAMAGGISGALVTTVLGLCVAIPTVLLHTVVNGRAQRVLHVLEEQSAGIIAEKAEG
ncbi:MAG: MotA/TolQ/ExbB proton channel family protein [Pseudomonadales bacterium]|nr:MotA/TolQ/ExbB proton channel family protein [Pseudomonadales bacterium]